MRAMGDTPDGLPEKGTLGFDGVDGRSTTGGSGCFDTERSTGRRVPSSILRFLTCGKSGSSVGWVLTAFRFLFLSTCVVCSGSAALEGILSFVVGSTCSAGGISSTSTALLAAFFDLVVVVLNVLVRSISAAAVFFNLLIIDFVPTAFPLAGADSTRFNFDVPRFLASFGAGAGEDSGLGVIVIRTALC